MDALDIPSFCLNLTRRPDRRLQAWQQFRREKLEVERIAAPDAANVESARKWWNRGARACALGHRLAWREAQRSGAEAVMVFEDDVVLCPGFRQKLEQLEVPDDWKMLYLGCTFRDVPEPVNPGLVRVRQRTWATHAMILRADILPELHRLLAPWSRKRNHPPIPTGGSEVAIDDLLCVYHAEWPVYACYPFLAWQAPGVSAIEEGRLSAAWDNKGRQLRCADVAARLDRLLDIAPPEEPVKSGPPASPRPGEHSARTQTAEWPADERSAADGARARMMPEIPASPAPLGSPVRLQNVPMFCLNLERRPDRRMKAWAQFQRHGLKVVRVAAPDAAHIEEKRGWMLKGYRACAAAHKLAMRAARRQGAGAVIIFEDDVILCPDFRQRFDLLKLPDDWGIFFFGCVFESPGPELLPNGLLRVKGGTFDNHAYALRAELWPELGRIYRRLSARCGNWHLNVPASSDRIVSAMQKRYAAYSVWPPMAWQSKGLSNNINAVNGNSDPQGRQIVFPEAISHLPWSQAIGKHPGDFETKQQSGLGTAATAAPPAEKLIRPASDRVIKAPPRRGRGFLLSPYSVATERMAWGQVQMLRRYNPEVPIVIYAQDYLPQLPWGGIAEVIRARGCHIGKDDLRWLNKLEALVDSPFEETVFFDCDMVSTGAVAHWFDALGTDDVTFWHHLRTVGNTLNTVCQNHLNPHKACRFYGIPAVPSTCGGGHYFVRKSNRSQRIIDRAANVMVEAMQSETALYWELAGAGNIVGDEPAVSMALIEMGVRLPSPVDAATSPVGGFIPPAQRWKRSDFEAGELIYDCEWAQGVRRPLVVHFAYSGKCDSAYNAWLDSCLPGPGRRLAGGATIPQGIAI